MMTYDIIKYTGSNYCYHYRALPFEVSEIQIADFCRRQKDRFLPVARAFDERANGLWVLRHYLAIKFTVSASMLSGSAIYAYERNLLMGVPYFNYYTLLNCCRAFLLTSPDVEWKGEKTMKMPHETILNLTGDLLRHLDPGRAGEWGERLKHARAVRETYSYRFPATGVDLVGDEAVDPEAIARLARLIAELAMLNSECFDAVLHKRVPNDIAVGPVDDHCWASAYDIAGAPAIDPDDASRFGKFRRGWGRVSTLEVMTSDGMMNDFYGGWTASDPVAGAFDPDDWNFHLLNL